MFEVRRSRRRQLTKPRAQPTPEMIRAMTEEIQRSWSPRERRRRASRLHPYHVMQMPLEPRRKGFCDD